MDTTTEELPLDISIEDAGPSAKQLSITIPAATVDEKIEESFGMLQMQSHMKGFRKGRAPRSLLEKRFGGDVMNEARGQLISTAYQQAIGQNELQVIGEPQFPDELADQSLERGTPYAFTVTIEVVPEFEMPELEGVSIKKPIFEIEDAHVDQETKRLQYRLGTPEQVTDSFQPLDRIVGQAVVTLEGHEGNYYEAEQALIVFPAEEDDGKGPVLGLLIEDLATTLTGTSVGDSIAFETTGPPSHEREEVRGKKLAITFDIKDAERITPRETGELCETLGLENEDMLKERVRFELESRRDEEQRTAEREQVYEYLLENTTMELPEKISEAQVASTIERQRMELLYKGEDPEQVELRLAEIRGQTEQQALNRLKLLFVMSKVARNFEIEVNEQEVNGRIAMIARQRGERPEKIREELTQSGGIQEVARQVAEHKAADRIVDQAKITEVPAAEWNDSARDKAAGSPATAKKKTKKSPAKKAAAKKSASKKTGSKKTASKKTGKKSS